VKSNGTAVVQDKFLPYYKVTLRMDLFMKNPTLLTTFHAIPLLFHLMIINIRMIGCLSSLQQLHAIFKAPEWIFLFRLQKFPLQFVHKKVLPRKFLKNDRLNLWMRIPWGHYQGQKIFNWHEKLNLSSYC
jgi:hypothetical protein